MNDEPHLPPGPPISDDGESSAIRTTVPPPTRGQRSDRARGARRRRALLVLVALLLVPVLAAGGAWLWYRGALDAGTLGARRTVTVQRGWGVAEIADALETAHVIDSSLAFRLYARLDDHQNFQAGDYGLREGMGVQAAVRALERGPVVVERRVQILPGKWLSEVATTVEARLGVDAHEFLGVVRGGEVRSRFQPDGVRTAEGLLAPDTYAFGEDPSATAVAQRFVDRFDELADAAGLTEGARALGRSPYEVVIVASLIQSEVRVATDGPLVASVVYNRLARGMRLQIDATVLYAIGRRSASNTAADRANDSPYNTYRVAGLPPTPIATVTPAALRAALHPASTDYLYYVLAGADGHHAFAATYAEHQRNVQAARAAGLLG